MSFRVSLMFKMDCDFKGCCEIHNYEVVCHLETERQYIFKLKKISNRHLDIFYIFKADEIGHFFTAWCVS